MTRKKRNTGRRRPHTGASRVVGALIALAVVGVAMPVHGFFQAHSFFNASDKYKNWFQETVWLQDTRADEFARGFRNPQVKSTTAAKYPYPEKPFAMTEQNWRESSSAIERGRSDWFDAEIIRQRAEVEEHAPAMDFLGWMYEQGQGIDRDYQKAFMWYERAKLHGQVGTKGKPAKIFERLKPKQKVIAKLQLAEDIHRIKRQQPTAVIPQEAFDTVKLHVFEEQRETDLLRKRRELMKREAEAAENN